MNWKKLKKDHLILLVGGNPLPNLVAARCLAKPKGHIWLLYTAKCGTEPGTEGVKDRLEASLYAYSQKEGLNWTVTPYEVSSSNECEITEKVQDLAVQIGSEAQVGVHYTGGTKPMAVHAYRELQKQYPQAVFTYLDPRELVLRVDRQDSDPYPLIRKDKKIIVPSWLQISLEEMAALHGVVQVPGKAEWAPSDTPGLAAVWQAIMKAHAEKDPHNRIRILWRDYPIWQIEPPRDEEMGVAEAFADFPGVSQALVNLCEVNQQPVTLRGVAEIIQPEHGKNFQGFKSCSKWFAGVWLEEYAWACVQEAVRDPELTQFTGRNLLHMFLEKINIDGKREQKKAELSKLKRGAEKVDFELDMAFLVGYQLFALSCTSSWKKARGLEHFFEVYVRACQMGGDEARFALVSCSNTPGTWEQQLAREWDAAGKIHVFGANNLPTLTKDLIVWYTESAHID